MKITKIEVKKLFNMFDYLINLNQEEKITIIHGPNGSGKTVILSMISSLFNKKYSIFRKIPFQEFRVIFDDSSALSIKANHKKSLIITHQNSNKEKIDAVELERSLFTLNVPKRFIEEIIPNLRQIGPDVWQDTKTDGYLTFSDIQDTYYDDLLPFSDNTASRDKQKETEWLEKILKKIEIIFIETNRLLKTNFSVEKKLRFSEKLGFENVVKQYAEDLANRIKNANTQYAQTSQQIDRTFPKKLIDFINEKKPPLTVEEITDELEKISDKRKQLVEAGLLVDDNEEENITVTEDVRNTLHIYVEDRKAKLEVLAGKKLLEQIKIFKEIITNRFSHKEIMITQNSGFTFTTNHGDPLDVSSLSSGEQQEIILFYKLIFETPPNSLVLIDEPELSLHIAWQQEFLKDVLIITQSSDFDVLIATHSPDIINDNWDLTVELGINHEK